MQNVPFSNPSTSRLFDIPGTAHQLGFTTLVTALRAAHLVEALLFSNGPFTVMAPPNNAFILLRTELLGCLLEPEGILTLQNILSYHVTSRLVLAENVSNNPPHV